MLFRIGSDVLVEWGKESVEENGVYVCFDPMIHFLAQIAMVLSSISITA